MRTHREKLGDVSIEEGEGVGRWLGVLSRAVVGAVGEGEEMGDWNVVQNNGPSVPRSVSLALVFVQGSCWGVGGTDSF